MQEQHEAAAAVRISPPQPAEQLLWLFSPTLGARAGDGLFDGGGAKRVSPSRTAGTRPRPLA